MSLLRAEGLRKSFPSPRGAVWAVDGVDLAVDPGEFLAVTGASGSGKSTLLTLLAGLDRPTGGSVLMDGRRLDELDERERARIRRDTVGFVFQSFHLVPGLTVLENIELPLAFGAGRFGPGTGKAGELLSRVGLGHRGDFLPGRLSGGEQQRAAIARSLMNDPLIVFADEPTGNLDSASGRRVMDLLEEHTTRQGRTLVLVTHDAGLAGRAHRRIHLTDGKIS